MKINRNIVTNIAGAIVAMWTSNQAVSGRLTINQLVLAVPTAIVSFATGSKDSKLEAIEQQLSPRDRAAVKGVGEIVLNQIANRFGYRVTSDDLDSGNSFDLGDGLGRNVVGFVDPQNGRRRSPELLDSMPEWSEGGTPTRLDIRAEAWRAADIARGRGPIEGTNITPSQYAAMSQPSGPTSDDPPSEAW